MGLRRLELPTLRLSGVRSNRLSYKPLYSPGDFILYKGLSQELRTREKGNCLKTVDILNLPFYVPEFLVVSRVILRRTFVPPWTNDSRPLLAGARPRHPSFRRGFPDISRAMSFAEPKFPLARERRGSGGRPIWKRRFNRGSLIDLRLISTLFRQRRLSRLFIGQASQSRPDYYDRR